MHCPGKGRYDGHDRERINSISSEGFDGESGLSRRFVVHAREGTHWMYRAAM